MCSDQATFLSADDLRINLWALEVAGQSFTLVDVKPQSMEDLTEVINPSHCIDCIVLMILINCIVLCYHCFD